MTALTIPFWSILAVALPALFLLALGLRGRRIDDHPWCRRCKYDLVAAGVETERCPECGRDLTRRGAVRTGRRVKRRAFVAAGGALLVVAIAGSVGYGWQQTRGLDPNRLKPVWLLVRHGHSPSATRADAALAELARRFQGGELDPDDLETVIATALAVQADPSATWRTGWGDLVDLADLAEMLTPEEIASYALHAVDLDWSHRPQVRRGEPLPLAHQFVRRRVGSRTRLDTMVRLDEVRVGPQKLSYGTVWGGAGYGISGWHLYGGMYEILGASDARSVSTGFDYEQLDEAFDVHGRVAPTVVDLAPGTYELSATWRVEISRPGGDRPLATFVRSGSVALDVLPADAETIAIEPAGATELPPTATAKRTSIQWRNDIAYVGGLLGFTPPVRDIAFAVHWRSGDVELLMGGCAIRATASPSQVFYRRSIHDEETRSQLRAMGERVDIVLRPSAAAARRTIDFTRIPDFEIVIEDVEVEVRTIE